MHNLRKLKERYIDKEVGKEYTDTMNLADLIVD